MLKNRLRLLYKISLFLMVFVCFSLPFVYAASNPTPPKDDQIKVEVYSCDVTGEVGGIGRNFISIIYDQTDKESLEMGIPMDKNTKGSMRKLSEIKTGDIVSVTYEETKETKKGEKPRVSKRLAKVVEFRRAASVAAAEGSVLENK
jgi:hypothetical protein